MSEKIKHPVYTDCIANHQDPLQSTQIKTTFGANLVWNTQINTISIRFVNNLASNVV